ncbi:unnamed protein product, partial [Prorocentrum cordatum]
VVHETENVLAGDNSPSPTPATATPWMAFFFVWTTVLGLYLKDPWIDAAARQCPDFPWSNPRAADADVGSAVLGGSAAATTDDALRLCESPGHPGPMPLFVRDHGLTACNFSTQDRARIKLPTEQPAAPRASDMAGHVGKIAESLQRTCCRVFQVQTAWRDYEVKASSWIASRGGFSGDICDPVPVATFAEDNITMENACELNTGDPTWKP